MVQFDISTQPRVLASTYSDVESTPIRSVTLQGNTGVASGRFGTVTASSKGDPKATACVDDTKSPTLAE